MAPPRKIDSLCLPLREQRPAMASWEGDVIVVGAGVMGSATAHCLALEGGQGGGPRVALLEQFAFGHDRGSSHGHSRIIRPTYREEHYAALMPEAYERWAVSRARCFLLPGPLAPLTPRRPLFAGARGRVRHDGLHEDGRAVLGAGGAVRHLQNHDGHARGRVCVARISHGGSLCPSC